MPRIIQIEPNQDDLAFPPQPAQSVKPLDPPIELTKDRLICYLKNISVEDEEVAHLWADEALLDYIGDSEITEAFRAVPKYYT